MQNYELLAQIGKGSYGKVYTVRVIFFSFWEAICLKRLKHLGPKLWGPSIVRVEAYSIWRRCQNGCRCRSERSNRPRWMIYLWDTGSGCDPYHAQNSPLALKSLLGLLRHPHVVPYKEFFNHDGNLCLVMAHCEGGDLFQYIRQKR